MIRIKRNLPALALAVLILCSGFTGCADFCSTKDTPTYTLNDYLPLSPENWNPHTRKSIPDNFIPDYAEMGLVALTIAADGENLAWVYEMATAIDDITAVFDDKDMWGITEEEGRIFRIKLNPDAKWENGDPINADTYMYSMKALLDPKMQNSRANTYCSGLAAIQNAGRYLNSGTPVYAAVVPAYSTAETPDYSYDISSAPVYLNLTSHGMTRTSAYSIADLYGLGYISANAYAHLAANANPFGFVEINADTEEAARSVVNEFLAAFGIAFTEEYYKEMLFYNTGTYTDSYDFENVGIRKSGDYELIYITAQQVQMADFLANMTTNWIVYEPLYEGGKELNGDFAATDYGTSADTYMSFGPYKLTVFEAERQILLEKNENWYGYTDGKHNGQYMTTTVKCAIIPAHATALQMFTEGKLDNIPLTDSDMTIYGTSEHLFKTDLGYTHRYVFATDMDKLAALETGTDENKKVLAYDDFRKAISLSIDRTTFAQQATPGYHPAYFLFSDAYRCDANTSETTLYRNTTAAKQAILDLYGIGYGDGKEYADINIAYASVTGYDAEEAHTLFQSVYEQAKRDGNYTDGQMITINCMVSAAAELTPFDRKQEQLLNEFVAAAAVGTGFEGRISFAFVCGAANRFEDVSGGKIEMIRSAWGGESISPSSLIRCYTEPDYMGGLHHIQESCGWNPSAEMLTLTIDVDGDGTDETAEYSLQDWAKRINGGIQDTDGSSQQTAITDADTQLTVLAALENAVLGSYQCIPFATETTCSLYSEQIRYVPHNYRTILGNGIIRHITYSYDDAGWDVYIASQGGVLRHE